MWPHPQGRSVFFSPQSVVPHAPWEAYGRGSVLLHNLVSESAHPFTTCQVRDHRHVCGHRRTGQV